MGGFVIDTGTPISVHGARTRFVLTPRGVQSVMKGAPHLIPDISLAALEDRSKSNGLTKAVLVVQVLYFCTSCVVRTAARVPLTLLEVTTLAHALCTLLTYAVWWTKPLNVLEPTLLAGGASDAAREAAAALLINSAACTQLPGGIFHFTHTSESRYLQTTYPLPRTHTPVALSADQDCVTLRPCEAVRIEHMYYALARDRSPHTWWKRYVVFGRGPRQPWYTGLRDGTREVVLRRQDLLRWTLRERARQRFGSTAFDLDPDRRDITGYAQPCTTLGGVPNWDVALHSYVLLLVCTACTAAYGLPHVLGWNTEFETAAEQRLWRLASITLSFIPVLLVASVPHVFNVLVLFLPAFGLLTNISADSIFKGILEPDSETETRGLPSYAPVLFHFMIPFGFLVYLLTSGYLLAMSILQLTHLPAGTRAQPAVLAGWPRIL